MNKNGVYIFGTSLWKWDPSLQWKCIKVGLPTSIFLVLELSSWGVFYSLMAHASNSHIIVAGICQSVLMLFIFFGVGLQKAVSAIGGNLIGANKRHQLKKLMRSALILVTGFSVLSSLPLVFFSDILINWFLQNPHLLEGGQELLPSHLMEGVHAQVKIGLVITCVYLLFENARWALSGLLQAAGDTLFLMISGLAILWLFMLIPAYVGIMVLHTGVVLSMSVWIFYSVMALVVIGSRYYREKWLEKTLIRTEMAEA